ncbi:MAG: hypothetical protein WCT18_01845 [Patescibacteria group bacterium]
MRKFLLGLSLLVVLFIANSCAEQELEVDSASYGFSEETLENVVNVQVNFVDEEIVSASFSDGTEVFGREDYLVKVKELYQNGGTIGEVSFAEFEKFGDLEIQRDPLTVKVPFTTYYITVSAHYGYVSGCIKKNVNHVNFIINQAGGSLVMDLHIAAWTTNGKLCMGIYNSKNGWCISFCSPSSAQISSGIKSAAIAVGISASAAAIVAAALTPVVIGSLSLAL